MKKTLFVLSGVAISALLAGCANSSSLKDQVKLVEFDNCLEHLISEKVGDSFKPYENYLKACEKYRP
jgi:hypothetical protein